MKFTSKTVFIGMLLALGVTLSNTDVHAARVEKEILRAKNDLFGTTVFTLVRESKNGHLKRLNLYQESTWQRYETCIANKGARCRAVPYKSVDQYQLNKWVGLLYNRQSDITTVYIRGTVNQSNSSAQIELAVLFNGINKDYRAIPLQLTCKKSCQVKFVDQGKAHVTKSMDFTTRMFVVPIGISEVEFEHSNYVTKKELSEFKAVKL